MNARSTKSSRADRGMSVLTMSRVVAASSWLDVGVGGFVPGDPVDRAEVVDVHGDPAEGVDQPAEAVEVDQDEVVDVQAQRLADAELEEVRAGVVGGAEDVRVVGGPVAVDRVEQAPALAPGVEAVRVYLRRGAF